MNFSRSKHGLALASAAVVASLSCGPLAGAAVAVPTDPPADAPAGPAGTNPQASTTAQQAHAENEARQEIRQQEKDARSDAKQDAAAVDEDQADTQSPGKAKGRDRDKGQGKANGPAKDAPAADGAPAKADPPGNNGTVKIAAPSDAVGHPSNNPHPGCSLVVEWFGYDAGADVLSTVTFAPQAPTGEVSIGGADPSQVFVGGDQAGGGTDLDGRQAYQLTFSGGAPHAQQGYHVKVTVATPYSLGNDTKTKVFWVEPCTATAAAPAEAPPSSTETLTPTRDVGGSSQSASRTPDTNTPDTNTPAADTPGGGAGEPEEPAIPTVIDAGEVADALPEWARSPLPLALLGAGVVLVGGAAAVRRSRA
ncbi:MULTISPECIES: hypothetical protein [unclassified Nocardioides]|uniref:hypothetical protein n=1 Tax=unclassified Nocardioides TaxID=2615069 RepID=UPI00361766C4